MSYALIRSDIAPLYAKTDQHGELADEVLYGMEVELEQTPTSGWLRARTHYGYSGFIEEHYLHRDAGAVSELRELPKMVVSAPYADILAEPRVQAARLAGVPRGGLVTVPGAADGGSWRQVMTVDGHIGYMKTGHLSPSPADRSARDEGELREALVSAAMGYLGTQYRWGGKTILGIDCSGLTAMAYMLNGIFIYRDAAIKPGFPIHEIDTQALGKGDLMFFPGHVAMYIGGGLFIHSTAFAGSDGVVINSASPEHPLYPCREDLIKDIYAAGSIF